MSRYLQSIRVVRPVRIAFARPPALTRGYPARSEMSENDAIVQLPIGGVN
jgi:hypothetical protein